jgi:hypothetical protein
MSKTQDLPTIVNNMTPERQKLLECLESKEYDTITELCKDAGVTRNVYYDAIQNSEFVDALFKTSKGAIYAAIPQIMSKMVTQAKRGSSVHQSMLLQMVKLHQEVPTTEIKISYSLEDTKEGLLEYIQSRPEWWEDIKKVLG